MTHKYLLLFLFFSCTFHGIAQQATYSISGKIVDFELKEPLIGASVYLEESGKGTTTDVNGDFVLDKLQADSYRLVVSYMSQNPKVLEVKITDKDIELGVLQLSAYMELDEVLVSGERSEDFGIQRLRQVEATAIYASKKNELIQLDRLTANKASNNSRQVYAKVSGLNIWESDGAGVQLGIGGRGLSPSRNSNFNTRQNGYDISADALGYPESYYTPPVESVERIEIVRGAASLQYGTQFGGMLNFKMKSGPKDKKVEVHSRQTLGSFDFFNSFNSVGGTVGKVNYYGFYQYKSSNGWRPNSNIEQHTAYLSAAIQLTPNLRIRPEYTHTQYLAQQAGGLTDAQFEADPRQSNRERNWFSVNWNLFALDLDYRISKNWRLNNRTFGLLAGRDAIGNLGNINELDFGDNRDFLQDDFRNWGNETRLLYKYQTFNNPSVFLVGMRYYRGKTLRRQGEGNDGADPDFEFLNPRNLEGSDFTLPSSNLSFFAENVLNLTPNWSITPGIRFEYINTQTDGYYRILYKDLAGNIINDERIEEQKENSRSFVFFGIGSSYRPSPNLEVYANFSQNYRAINFNDIRVNVGSLVVDENLSDERGFNLDLGARGRVKDFLEYDISVYHLSYKDRIGAVLKREPNPVFNNLVDRIIRFRTNVADANIYGLESVVEWHPLRMLSVDTRDFSMSIFTNFSLTEATYTNSQLPGIDGNDVELVPPMIFKVGLNLGWKTLKAGFLYGYTKEHFSDATNAVRSPTAIEGIIPSYEVLDLSLSYSFKWLELEGGINNMLNNIYFTRRASGYPGPGILPSDGRSFYLTLGIRL
ncbi:MAG: TonB-dependent receptor [Bacteroidota bacterium]